MSVPRKWLIAGALVAVIAIGGWGVFGSRPVEDLPGVVVTGYRPDGSSNLLCTVHVTSHRRFDVTFLEGARLPSRDIFRSDSFGLPFWGSSEFVVRFPVPADCPAWQVRAGIRDAPVKQRFLRTLEKHLWYRNSKLAQRIAEAIPLPNKPGPTVRFESEPIQVVQGTNGPPRRYRLHRVAGPAHAVTGS